MVDDCFEQFLKSLFGDMLIDRFKEKMPQGWLELMKNFDTAKKLFNSSQETRLRVQLGYLLIQEICESKNKGIKSVIEPLRDVSFNNGYLIVEHKAAYPIFFGAITRIVEHMKEILNKTTGVKYVLLVGGFGESDVLKKACESGFGDKVHILTPLEAQTAVVKGAVLFGLNPRQISIRIARYTYGINCRMPFKDGVHDLKRKVKDEEGKERCEGCFSVFITKDEKVTTEKARLFYYRPAIEGQTVASMNVYKIDKTKVMYIDEEGVKKLGHFELRSSDGPLGQDLEVRVTFGHTELMVEARDKSKNEDFKVNTVVDL